MRKFALLIIIFIIAVSNITYARTPEIYAVVVGVANYKDNNIPNLKFSEKDAKDFNDFLKSPYAGAISNENIALLIGPNATRSNIIRSLVEMSKRCTKDDMIIFYYSGHGEADEGDNSGYLLSYDAASNDAPSTAISMEEINNRLTKCAAKLKVSYVDACHAGMFTSNGKGSMDADNEIIATSFMQSVANAGDGNVAFLASSAKQQSQESDKLGNGVFTYYLLKGLTGEADKYQKQANGYNDGIVTVGEMVTYLNDKIPAATKYNQKPTVQGIYDEAFPLSILTSNSQIAEVIAKRPERKKIIPSTLEKNVSDKPADEKLSPGKTWSWNTCYGVLTFINNSKYLLNLYKINILLSNSFESNISIAPEKMATTPRIAVAGAQNVDGCIDKFHDCEFSFYINDGSVTKYATFRTSVEGGKNQYLIIDSTTLSFSTNKPH